ncbi:ribonuclease H-like domain-containing protein [Tanacetum coccineum]
METEEISERYIAPCFVNGLKAYDEEINLEQDKNLILNEFAVKLCLEHEVKDGEKVVKKELIVALRGEIYFVKFIINLEEDDIKPRVILGRSFMRLTKGIADFRNGVITIYPELDPFLDKSEEIEKFEDDWEFILDGIDFGDILEINKAELPPQPLTQEEAAREAIVIDIYKRFSILEEARPVIETMAYKEEEAVKRVMGEALKEKENPGPFVILIRLEVKIDLNALADTGSDTNVMPFRIYSKLGRDEVKPMNRGITMLNHSKAEPMGLLKDVLCQIGVTTIIAKFLILHMPVDKEVLILVGRGFLYTCGSILIDQGEGSTSGIRAYALRYFDLEEMELENSQNNALAKLPMLKLGVYEMWEIRIKQYFQIQDYALWEVIENGNSWVPIPVTAPESGPSTILKMTVLSTAKEKICKKNDVKARSLLLMALPNEHQLTFNQYVDCQSMFASIKARFGGNEATKRTQKALLKQQYENFNDSSSESLDSIFNRPQKLVSRLAILGVVWMRSLPSEWDTHVVVWINKPDFDTMGLDDLYNNFKIVEQKVKKSIGAINDEKNLAFLTTSGASSTTNINTINREVSTGTTKVNTTSPETDTASFSDATIMRARKFYQRTGRKNIIDGSSTARYNKSKVECFNCHKMGHFARECRAPKSKDNRNWNQGGSSKAVRIEDASKKAMCVIDGAGFDWSDMAVEEIQANMAFMAFSDSEVSNDKSCSKSCLQNYEALKKQYDDLLVKLDDTGFKASTYKRGHKEYLMGLLKTELEKVKEEKEGFEFKIAKFEKSSKDLDQLLASQITDKSKKGFGYNVVPSPHPLILNRPTCLDLSYSGLEEFKQPEVNEYGPRDSSVKPTTGCDKESDNSKENIDDSLKQQQMTDFRSVKSPLKVDKDWKEKFFSPANQVREEAPKKARQNYDVPIIEDWVSDDEDDVESIPKVEKKTVIPTATKKESVKPETPVKRSVSCPNVHKHMILRAVLMKTGLKTVNNTRPVNTVRSVNTARPFSTARDFNTVRPSYTAHPKSIVHCAKPRTHFNKKVS